MLNLASGSGQVRREDHKFCARIPDALASIGLGIDMKSRSMIPITVLVFTSLIPLLH